MLGLGLGSETAWLTVERMSGDAAHGKHSGSTVACFDFLKFLLDPQFGVKESKSQSQAATGTGSLVKVFFKLGCGPSNVCNCAISRWFKWRCRAFESIANMACLNGESISIATPTKNHSDNVFVSANMTASMKSQSNCSFMMLAKIHSTTKNGHCNAACCPSSVVSPSAAHDGRHHPVCDQQQLQSLSMVMQGFRV